MEKHAFAITLVSSVVCSCAVRHAQYVYEIGPAHPALTPTLTLTAIGQVDGIQLELTNNSTATARIIWERCAFIDVDGQSGAMVITGQKYIEANKPAAPTVVPPRASASVLRCPPTT